MAYYTAYSEQMKEGEVEGVAVMFVPLVPFVTLVPLVPLGQSLHKHLLKYLCPTIWKSSLSAVDAINGSYCQAVMPLQNVDNRQLTAKDSLLSIGKAGAQFVRQRYSSLRRDIHGNNSHLPLRHYRCPLLLLFIMFLLYEPRYKGNRP